MPGPGELGFQRVLRTVGEHEDRAEREDPFHVGIQQRAHARQLLHLGRVVVVAADGDHLRACADGEEHLGQCRHERNDARRTWYAGLSREPRGFARQPCKAGPP